jgi:hypothetical protein
LHDGIFYISWLGATEVREWVLRSGFSDDEEWTVIARFRKDGFETHYTLPAEQRIKRWVKAYALGDNGEELGSSESLDVADQITMWYVHGPVEDKGEEVAEDEESESEGSVDGYYSVAGAAMAIIGLCGMLVLLGVLVCLPNWRTIMGRNNTNGIFAHTSGDEEQSPFLQLETGEQASIEVGDARDVAWRSRAET